MENVFTCPTTEELEQSAGFCLDLAHLDSERLLIPDVYSEVLLRLEQYPIVANHISAMLLTKKEYRNDPIGSHAHTLTDLKQLDYLRDYPPRYFGQYVAIELSNTIEKQLEIKKYIEAIIESNHRT
jgi:hypothetical protein